MKQTPTLVISNHRADAASLRDPLSRSDAGGQAKSTSLGRVHAIPVPQSHNRSGVIAEALYRAFEILLSLTALIVGLPLMSIMAAAVRIDSPGPALFAAKRTKRSVAVRGRDLEARPDLCPPPGGYEPDTLYYVPSSFIMYKFRTMYRDARTRFPEYYAYDFASENFHDLCFKTEHDPRITRVGRVLRPLSVDELPNLWSVVTGEMRLVGPRPETEEVLQYYSREEMLKFTCKPGVTGLAQIGGRGLLTWGETLALDLEYVRTRSIALDLKIILRTIKLVFLKHGAF
jgi:lipopolysaccharide/colanic/teichoic acid biosynthesis glycosyltransferase